MKEEKLSVYKYSVCNSMYNSDKLKLNVQWYEDNLLYDKLDVFVFLSNMKTVMKQEERSEEYHILLNLRFYCL